MIRQRDRRTLLEAILLAAAPAAANLILGGDPGFLSVRGAPILAVGPLFASFYGFGWGLAEALLAAALGFLAAPALAGAFDASWPAALAARLPGPAGLALVALLALGFFRHRVDQFRDRALTRFRRLVHRAVSERRKSRALEGVNRVLESRVSGQKDSITLLHNQVRKLASLSLEQALVTVLETVELFTETSSASIWTLDPLQGRLVPAAVRGWGEGRGQGASLDPEASIVGYVLRNRVPFSARMLLDSPEFDRFDSSRNVITLPIVVKDKAWGVLNIEDLPFERYSLYTESLLAILLSLAEPYLRAIVEYESLHAQREVDEDTGFPQYPVLWTTLRKELERKAFEPGFTALVVVEMANFEEALTRWPRAELKRLLFEVKTAFDAARGMKAQAFHFKNDGQFALLLPGLDQDGASFLCLDLLTTCSGLSLSLGGEAVPLEIIVGFASSSGGGDDPDTMIETAEHLLSIQRL